MAVGVDAAFDGGAAAWMLDVIGCVATARSEEAAIDAVPREVRT
jgi:hypothetical protein